MNMLNNFYKKSLVSVESLRKEDIIVLFEKADEMKKLVETKGGDDRLKGKILAALFYEPSSRTFTSFVTAMQRLGGGFIPLNNMIQTTSVTKGETLEDTARVFSEYADIIVMRHPEAGSVKKVADNASIPVINAGDGVNEHPTQALLDSYTILESIHSLEKIHIMMIGDLAHYRPVNSLAKLLAIFPKIKMTFISPKEVAIQNSLRKYLIIRNISLEEKVNIGDEIEEIDVLYVTRVKKEYMSEELYQKVQGSYVIDKKIINKMKQKSIIMHPLPRVGEIATEVDDDIRAVYFKRQLRNGLYVRMAILDLIINR